MVQHYRKWFLLQRLSSDSWVVMKYKWQSAVPSEFLKKFRYCRNASSSGLLITYNFLPSRLCASGTMDHLAMSTKNALREIYPHLNRALAIFIPNIINRGPNNMLYRKNTNFHFLPNYTLSCSIQHKSTIHSHGTDGYSRYPFFQFRKSFS